MEKPDRKLRFFLVGVGMIVVAGSMGLYKLDSTSRNALATAESLRDRIPATPVIMNPVVLDFPKESPILTCDPVVEVPASVTFERFQTVVHVDCHP